MNLIVDIGNTCVKLTGFEADRAVAFRRLEGEDLAGLETALDELPGIEAAIVSSTRGDASWAVEGLRRRCGRVLAFGPQTPVPIVNRYRTPATLGSDRLAAAVGAAALFPARNVLVVDFGTALTFDTVTDRGEFAGGFISPGVALRYEALHRRTAALPRGVLPEPLPQEGVSTAEAVEGGVARSVLFEVEGYMAEFARRYPDPVVIFTGGDADYFAKHIKKTIFAHIHLVAYGLNRILEYNAH